MKSARTYALIQLCPDRLRAEAVNVGVVVVDGAQTVVKIDPRAQHARQFFGKLLARPAGLASTLRAFARRCEDVRTAEELAALRGQEMNDFRLSVPSMIRCESALDGAAALFSDYVTLVPHRSRRAAAPDIASYLEPLRERGLPVDRDVVVKIPVLEVDLQVAFRYQNGRSNLIVPMSFTGPEKVVRRRAEDMGTKGLLAHRYLEAKVVVVGEFGDVDEVRRVAGLLREMNTELVVYSPEAMEGLAARVAEEAHEAVSK